MTQPPTSIKEMPMKDYIGDGVYVGFDGYGIWLCANDADNPTDSIYLEPSIITALNRFAERTKECQPPSTK